LTDIRQLPNVGYLEHEFTEKQLRQVWTDVEAIQADFAKATPIQQGLAGQIEHSYLLSEKTRLHLEYLMAPLTRRLHEAFPVFERDLTLSPPWVNFQKKHEFNPTHLHTGILSWVLWLQIPYTSEEEKAKGPGRGANKAVNGEFEFVYASITGTLNQYQLPVDKSWEGRLVLFPSQLNHAVYPFYSSDEYRISVSGNFVARPPRARR